MNNRIQHKSWPIPKTGTTLGILFVMSLLLLTTILTSTPSAAKENPEEKVTLTTNAETIKMIAGQSVDVTINVDRNGFEEPITLVADMPEGFDIEFFENPVAGDSTTARIYSPINVLQCENSILFGSEEFPEPTRKLRLLVDCGLEWVEQFGTNEGDAEHNDKDTGNAVTTDNDGNIYVVGSTFGSFDPESPAPGNRDVWVAKYLNDGTPEWTTQLGGSSEDFITEVAVDNEGNVFTGGFTHGDMPGNSSRGNLDYWIAKFDNSGELQWLRQDGNTGQDGKFGTAIIPDNQGGARLATVINERSGVGIYDYGTGGGKTVVAEKSLGNLRDSPYDLALTVNDELFVVGSLNISGQKQGYIIKYDVNGSQQPVWQRTDLGINGDREATRVAVEPSGDLYVAGIDVISGTDANAWFGKFSSANGSNVWSSPSTKRIFSQPNKEDLIKAIGINQDGDLIVAGSTTGVIGERNGSGSQRDAWVSRYSSSSGELQWINQFPVGGEDSIEALAFDNEDGIILAGNTERWRYNSGSPDALLARFVDAPPTFVAPIISDYTVQTLPNGNRYIEIEGEYLLGTTSVRIDGVVQGIATKSEEQVITDSNPLPSGPAVLTISTNCRVISQNITIP